MNKIIAQKIKEAREEKGFTQKDLAEHLDKNAVSVSDIERNRVEVSAIELYNISKFLQKPLEYFYNEDAGSNEIQEVTTMLKRQTKADVKDLHKTIKLIIQLKDVENIGRKFPPNQKVPNEKLIEFSTVAFPLKDVVNELSERTNNIAKLIYEEMKIRKIVPPSKK